MTTAAAADAEELRDRFEGLAHSTRNLRGSAIKSLRSTPPDQTARPSVRQARELLTSGAGAV